MVIRMKGELAELFGTEYYFCLAEELVLSYEEFLSAVERHPFMEEWETGATIPGFTNLAIMPEYENMFCLMYFDRMEVNKNGATLYGEDAYVLLKNIEFVVYSKDGFNFFLGDGSAVMVYFDEHC